MPRKAKTEENVVIEESATLENAPAETGTLMEGGSPREDEIYMNGDLPADGGFPMDGEPDASDGTSMNEDLADMEGKIPEETPL